VFGNRVVMGVLGLNREEKVGGWTKLHIEEHSNFYYWDDK